MQQTDYIPGMYVRAWRRHTTEKLRSMRKSLQPVKLERATDEIHLADLPTSILRVPKITERLLPLDTQGRPHLKKVGQDRPLLDLCDEIIREYRFLSGEYPAELVLSAFRYLTLDPVSRRFGGYCTFNGDTFIRYTYDLDIRFPDYCIMARGLAQDAWIR